LSLACSGRNSMRLAALGLFVAGLLPSLKRRFLFARF